MTYIDGCIIPVSAGTTREAYAAFAAELAAIFTQHGAIRVVDAWGDDVPEGKLTDLRRAVQAQDGETVVFSWIEWPSKDARAAAWERVMADPRMRPGVRATPFDGKRMIFGGFAVVADSKANG